MSRRYITVTVTGTGGALLSKGDVVTGSAIDNVVVANGYVQVKMELATIVAQKGASHLFRWNGTTYQRAIESGYGDYTFFTNTPAARPDRVTVVEASNERAEISVEWDAYNLVDASTFPLGIAYRDHSNALNYAQGQVNPNWKYLTATRLVKTIIVEIGREGYFVGFHSDPLIGPVASRIPTDNNETIWGERELGTGGGTAVAFSSANVTRRNPAEGSHKGLGIDDPVSLGGAEQTTGPWWVGDLPNASSATAGMCRYVALRERLQILDYQFDPAQYGFVVILGVNEARDDANVPYRSMLFIGAFPYTVSDFAAEPTAALRARLVTKCPSDFEESGEPDDEESMPTTTATAIRDRMITVTKGKTPTSHSSYKFVEHDNQSSLREWAAQNPGAAFRKFTIRQVLDFQEPRISNTTEEEVWTTFEVVVAYPTAGKGLYGSKQQLSLETVMEQDLHQLRHAIGVNGYATLDVSTGGAATVVEDGPSVEMGDPVSFVVLNLRTRYLRSLS